MIEPSIHLLSTAAMIVVVVAATLGVAAGAVTLLGWGIRALKEAWRDSFGSRPSNFNRE